MLFHVEHPPQMGVELASVPRETRARLDSFVKAVLSWNRVVNLISTNDEAHIWRRHVSDCLQLACLIPPGCRSAVDLGSGGGFPGLILAILTNIQFHLVEADKRKAAFLVHAAQLAEVTVRVHPCRIEACGLTDMDVATSRALAPLNRLLEYATPLLAPSGTCLFLKGGNVASELDAVSTLWRFRVQRIASRMESGGEILRIDRISRA